MNEETLNEEAQSRGFCAATLDPAAFGHREHIHVAWCFLQRYPMAEAFLRFDGALRRFVKAVGAESKYHATVTWAFLALVNERMIREGPADSWKTFIETHPDLLNKSILADFYPADVLASEAARQTFLLPWPERP